MKRWISLLAVYLVVCSATVVADVSSMKMRTWTATTGHTLEAKVTGFKMGKVRLERADGKVVVLSIEKLVQADQELIEDHYNRQALKVEDAKFSDEKPASFDHDLGVYTDKIATADGFHCYMYCPKSLRDDALHPVVFIQDPGSGRHSSLKRYAKAAELNRWILATSPESSNKLDYKPSYKAIVAMMEYVKENYPIDPKRIYLSGFSGGSRYSFYTASMNDVAGIIACGAGAGCHAFGQKIPNNKVVTYGLCGTNCFNRYDMAVSHAQMKNKDSMLRYFVGKHDWANSDLLTDAMIHLNGVFFQKNPEGYEKQQARFVKDVLELIDGMVDDEPHRAYMLSKFMIDRGLTSGAREVFFQRHFKKLKVDSKNVDFVEGLAEMDKVAKKVFGEPGMDYRKEYDSVKEVGAKYAKKYQGTALEPVFEKFKTQVVQP